MTNEDIKPFLEELVSVCKKHNLSLSHEDYQGGFLVEEGYNEKNAKWLLAAGVWPRIR